MDEHAGVLEQRIKADTVRHRSWQAGHRIRKEDKHDKEKCEVREYHAVRIAHQRRIPLTHHVDHHAAKHRQERRPVEQGALLAGIERGQGVIPGHRRAGMERHIPQAKVLRDERVDQDGRRHGQQERNDIGSVTAAGRERSNGESCPEHGCRAAVERSAERENQRNVTGVC